MAVFWIARGRLPTVLAVGFFERDHAVNVKQAKAVHHCWADIPAEAVNASTLRRFVTAERVTVARFEMKRGGTVPHHSHDNEQVTCILSGALKFTLDGQGDIVVRAGEVLHIPSWLPHSAEVLEDSVAIDVFSPVRQDWIDKTDDYFRK
jgi:quercetin dioxygenase-like cupin family protein